VLVFVRVSHRNQRHNLRPQARALVRACRRRGLKVRKILQVEQSAKLRDQGEVNDSMLRYAVELALAHGWAIVAESETRLIRHTEYTPQNQLQPTLISKLRLARLLDGQAVYLLQPPGSTPRQIRRRETRRGMHGKNQLGGRPPKMQAEERLQQCLKTVLYRRRLGWSLRRISARLLHKYGVKLSHTGVARWLKKYGCCWL
jgi:hypothetical protein